jgi:hypothetical protein
MGKKRAMGKEQSMNDHHHGLAVDLERLLGAAASRRQSLRWLPS